MDYTLTRIDPNGENDRYPLQKSRRSQPTLWSKKLTKTCLAGASSMTWLTGVVKTQFGRITSVFPAVTLRW